MAEDTHHRLVQFDFPGTVGIESAKAGDLVIVRAGISGRKAYILRANVILEPEGNTIFGLDLETFCIWTHGMVTNLSVRFLGIVPFSELRLERRIAEAIADEPRKEPSEGDR